MIIIDRDVDYPQTIDINQNFKNCMKNEKKSKNIYLYCIKTISLRRFLTNTIKSLWQITEKLVKL